MAAGNTTRLSKVALKEFVLLIKSSKIPISVNNINSHVYIISTYQFFLYMKNSKVALPNSIHKEGRIQIYLQLWIFQLEGIS